jgi:hypothetical protein
MAGLSSGFGDAGLMADDDLTEANAAQALGID